MTAPIRQRDRPPSTCRSPETGAPHLACNPKSALSEKACREVPLGAGQTVGPGVHRYQSRWDRAGAPPGPSIQRHGKRRNDAGNALQHLGGVSAIGVNCASCHLGEVGLPGKPPIRVVGMTSHFDPEAFFGAVTVAMLRSAEPNGMMRFLKHYVLAGSSGDVSAVEASINRQIDKIESVVRNNPFGAVGIKPGQLHELDSAALAITPAEVIGGADLVPTVRALLQTFYNMRTALHLPAEPERRRQVACNGLLVVPVPVYPTAFGHVPHETELDRGMRNSNAK